MSSVVIVGGGVAGLCSAWYLTEKGFDVTVIDTERPGGCSTGNAGMIVPSHFIPLASPGMPLAGIRMLLKPDGPFAIRPRLDPGLFRWASIFLGKSTKDHVNSSAGLLWKMNFESGQLYKQFSRHPDFDFKLEDKGLIVYCKEAKTLEHESEVAEMAGQVGARAEVLDKTQLEKLDPGLQLDVSGGVYYPEDAFFIPELFIRQLSNGLLNKGVRFENLLVDNFTYEDNTLKSIQGLEADHFVISAGIWSTELVKQLGVRMPMQGGKGYSFTLPKPKVKPEICSILIEARIAVTPMDTDLRFAGTMQLDGTNASINKRRLNGIKRRIPDYFPEFESRDFDGIDTWVGLRPCSPDGLPYVGKLQPFSNVFVATGGAMMGMSLGPWMGKMISENITQEAQSNPQLSPNRYS